MEIEMVKKNRNGWSVSGVSKKEIEIGDGCTTLGI